MQYHRKGKFAIARGQQSDAVEARVDNQSKGRKRQHEAVRCVK